MTIMGFLRAVLLDERWGLVAVAERDGADSSRHYLDPEDVDEVRVRCVRGGWIVGFPSEGIEDCTWEELLGVLTGDREPRTLVHMDRIVGYYCRAADRNGAKRLQVARPRDCHGQQSTRTARLCGDGVR